MATTTNNGWTTPDDTDLVKDGALAIRDLGQEIDTSVGTGLLAWTAYTPTFTAFSLGNGSINWAYSQIGKTVFVRGRVTLGSTSTMTGPFDFTLPVTSVTYPLTHVIGQAAYYSGSVFNHGSVLAIGSTSTYRCGIYNVSGTYATNSDLSATAPFTWANTHQLTVVLTYQAA
jgi:hypothetical protein